MRILPGLVIAATLLIGHPAGAQDFDPEESVRAILTAFQQCGPPAAYQALSPGLFQIVAQQTGGTGCYPPIAAAGPIQDTKLMESRDFPIGPLYIVRVTHPSGPVDWFIGFNRATGKIEYLTFQTVVVGSSPSITKGPTPKSGEGIPQPPPPKASTSEACKKFPAMCT